MNGYGNLYALFDKLALAYSFGAFPNGEDIVVGGEGAGAVGAAFMLELESQKFEDLIQATVGFNGYGARSVLRVLGLFDSALQLNVGGYGFTANPFAAPLRALTTLLQFFDNMDTTCLQGERYTPWRCIFSEFQFKYLTHPFVYIADQYDSQTLNALM
jgi:hypothetical protein